MSSPSSPPPTTAPLSELSATDPSATDPSVTEAFVLRAAELLHRYGTPSHRLERVMTQVAATLGIQGVFLYTPTALVVSLKRGERESTYVRRVDSGLLDVSKLFRFDEILEQLEGGEIDLATAAREFESVAVAPPPFGPLATSLAYAAACASVGVLFGAGVREVALAGVIGFVLSQIERFSTRTPWERGTLEPLSGALAAIVALAVAHWVVPLDDRLVTLASLVVLLPGLSLTVAMTELAVGHLSAGVARMAGALVTLLALVLGIALAWRLGGGLRNLPVGGVESLPEGFDWLAYGIAPAAFAVLFRAPMPQWPVIYTVSLLGVCASRLATAGYGIELGAFSGALSVGCGSNLYARIWNRPALVALTPGTLVLVPGSVGYQSLTALVESQTLQGVEFAFRMLMIAISLVGGLLVANLLLPPRRIL